ncbi:MAG: gliding motility-associated C-terminal domain-containing protein [Bacteroidota bacterium]|nr:gliding motility-associated C-terminal domain-containing protein [Bacteroidota bacterium]
MNAVNAQFGNVWPVGKMQGIDFNGKNAKLIKTGINNDSISPQPRYNEAHTSAISDCNGKILFYTNGVDIWNKNDTFMDNGRLKYSSPSSSRNRNCLIIPIPQKPNLYYVFYMVSFTIGDPFYYQNSFSMALVDLNFNGGLGKVVFKDSVVMSGIGVSCNLTFAKHSNNTDIWLIVPKNQTQLLSFKITSTGLNKTPVTSNVTTSFFRSYVSGENNHGFIKMNSDFSRLFVSGVQPNYNNNGHVLQYDFNRTTGSFSNEKTLVAHNEFKNELCINLAISPNDSFLYITTEPFAGYTGNFFGRILQYNLYTNRKQFVRNFPLPKGVAKGSGPNGYYGMQTAPDGKIYVFLLNKIHRINFPNKRGSACQVAYWDSLQFMKFSSCGPFDSTELDGGGDYKYGCGGNQLLIYSLPNTYSPEYKLFYSASTDANPCTDTTTITYLGDSSFYKLVWFFGDGDSLVQNYPNIKTGMKIKHRYQQDGFYEVRLKSYHAVCNRIKEYTDSLLIKKQPLVKQFNLSQNHACYSDTLLLNATFKDAHQLICAWSPSQTDTLLLTSNQLQTQKVYFNEQKQHLNFKLLSNNGCFSNFKDSFTSVFNPKPKSIILINQDTLSVLKSNNINRIFKQCEPASYHIKDHNSSTQNLWLFNNQDSVLGTNNEFNFVNFHTNQGLSSLRQYITKSINQFNCYNLDTFYTQTYTKPVANFNLLKDSQCLRGNQFEFINQSQYNGNSDSLVYNTYWNQNHQNQTLNKKINDTGSHHFKAIVKGEFFCSDTFEQNITVLPHPESNVKISLQQHCFNDNLTELEFNSNDSYTIIWGDGTINQLNTHVYNLPTSYSISAIAQNTFGCTDTSILSTEIYSHPVADFNFSKDEICINEQPFNVQTNSTYSDVQKINNTLIFDNQKFTNQGNFNQNYEFLNTGNYSIKLISKTDKGCLDSIEKNMVVRPFTDFEFTFKDKICLGDEQILNIQWSHQQIMNFSTFNGNNALNYSPNFGKTEAMINYTPLNTGVYKTMLVSTNEFACKHQKDYEYQVVKLPIANFNFRKTESTENGTIFKLTDASNTASQWDWRILLNNLWYNSQEQHPEITFADTGRAKAYLFITDQNQCKDSTSRNLLVYPSFVFFFPEAISANNDGLNEYFKVSSPYFIKEYHLEIYNRWGQKIFETKNPNEHWVPNLEGVYLYRTFIKDLDNKIKNQSGTITVLR